MKSNCKNIWVFNHYAITPDLPGGTRHFDFAEELVNSGYNVTIFASSFIHGIFEEKKTSANKKWCVEDYKGVKFVWIKTFPYRKNDWRRVINMLTYTIRSYWLGRKITKLNECIPNPDIIIGSSWHLFAAFSAYMLSRKYRAPFIMEVRDLWPQTPIDMGMSKWHPFIIVLSILEKFLYNRSDKIITLLPKANEYIEGLGVPENKIVWMPNGVNINRFTKFANSSANKTGAEFLVVYTGSVGKANAVSVIIKAAEILKKHLYNKIKFLIIGDGAEKENLMKIVERKQLDNVEFKHSVEKEKIPIILINSAVLIFILGRSNVYKYGISSNKLFDYMASGRPIIFSVGSSNNPVKEANAGITVPPEDPKALAEAIIRMYNMPEEERKKMGQNGLEYVIKYHSIPVLVDKLEGVINEVCTKSNF